ncbi:hypothetical protein [Xenorhabdus vietnamensis]|uniref:hypothetical protein n=1 Tax=Xenorhabdus vietnamensis TaxID=351656 RepID=UPI00111C80D9|nr:hypothetical protein [Xenorhabdus vietnamensis]
MWYICTPLEADIIAIDDEGFFQFISDQQVSHPDGECLPVGQRFSVFFYREGEFHAQQRTDSGG